MDIYDSKELIEALDLQSVLSIRNDTNFYYLLRMALSYEDIDELVEINNPIIRTVLILNNCRQDLYSIWKYHNSDDIRMALAYKGYYPDFYIKDHNKYVRLMVLKCHPEYFEKLLFDHDLQDYMMDLVCGDFSLDISLIKRFINFRKKHHYSIPNLLSHNLEIYQKLSKYCIASDDNISRQIPDILKHNDDIINIKPVFYDVANIKDVYGYLCEKSSIDLNVLLSHLLLRYTNGIEIPDEFLLKVQSTLLEKSYDGDICQVDLYLSDNPLWVYNLSISQIDQILGLESHFGIKKISYHLMNKLFNNIENFDYELDQINQYLK